MKKFLLLFFVLLTPVIAQESIEVTAEQITAASAELGASRVNEVKTNVMACLKDVNECDCEAFNQDEAASSYCNKLVAGAVACLTDFLNLSVKRLTHPRLL